VGKRKTQTQTVENQIPSWLEGGSRQAIDSARSIADRPYTPYEGQRVAGLTPNETAAISMAGQGTSAYQPYYDKAAGALGGLQSWLDVDQSAYMNPYIEQVLAPTARRRQRAFDTELSNLRSTAGMRDAFGGRHNVSENLLRSEHEIGLDELYGAGYGAAFDQARGAFEADQQRKLAEAGAYQSLGSEHRTAFNDSIRNMLQTGLVGRTQEQQALDWEYFKHIEERDWDITNLQPLLEALSSVPHGTTQTQTDTSSGGGLQQILGLASTVIGSIYGGPLGGAAGSAFGGMINDGGGSGGGWDPLNSNTWDWNTANLPMGGL